MSGCGRMIVRPRFQRLKRNIRSGADAAAAQKLSITPQ